MEKTKFTDNQIAAILKQYKDGATAQDLCREHNISSTAFYRWRAKFGNMNASLIKRMKALEAENKRLKKMCAEEKLVAEVRQDLLDGKY